MAKPSLDPNKDWEELLKSELTKPSSPTRRRRDRSRVPRRTSPISISYKPEELELPEPLRGGAGVGRRGHRDQVCTHFNGMARPLHPRGGAHRREHQEQYAAHRADGRRKTYIIKLILHRRSFVKADATKFSETGYVGGDEDLVRELVHGPKATSAARNTASSTSTRSTRSPPPETSTGPTCRAPGSSGTS